MILKLIFKEWKERFGLILFAVAIIGLFALSYVVFREKTDLISILTGTMMLLFLTFMSWVIGASAWESEHKNGAWAYLFSKPLSKWKIWEIKFISMLSLVALIVGLFYILSFVLPGFRSVISEFSFPVSFVANLSFISFSVLFSLCAFSIAFSFSFFSRNFSIIVFASILTGLGILLFIRSIFGPMQSSTFQIRAIYWIIIWFALSFLAGSLITFLRADFSQPKKQAWTFIKYSVAFLVVFAGLFLTIATISGGLRYDESIYSIKPSKRDIFFASVKGIHKYSSDENTVEKIIKNKPEYSFIYSIRAGKIIYQHYGRRGGFELCLTNKDGSEANLLIHGGYKAKDPDLHWVQSSIISPDASQAAFLSHGSRKGSPLILWRVNSDGTGLKKFPLNYAGYSSNLIAWPEFENSVYISTATYPNPQDIRILKFDFLGGTLSFVAESLSRPYRIGVSPQHDKIAFVAKPEETNLESLVYIDLKTKEKRVILEEDPLILRSFKWNEIGSECIFSIDRPQKNVRLFYYSITSGKIRKLLDVNTKQEHYLNMQFDWIFENSALVVYYILDQKQKLEILDLPSLQRKTIKIPDKISNNCRMHTADDKVFFHVFKKRDLWRLDLRTEKWKRVY